MIASVIAIIVCTAVSLAAALLSEVERNAERRKPTTRARLCAPLPTARVVTPRPWWRRWGRRG